MKDPAHAGAASSLIEKENSVDLPRKSSIEANSTGEIFAYPPSDKANLNFNQCVLDFHTLSIWKWMNMF